MRQDESSYQQDLECQANEFGILLVENRKPLKVYELGKDLRKVVFKEEVVSRIAQVAMKEAGMAFKGSCGHPGMGEYSIGFRSN